METIEGTVDRVVYSSDDRAWAVIKFLSAKGEPLAAVGNLLGVSAGERLRLTGEMSVDKKYGRQFRVSSYLTIAPQTLEGIQRYLGSGLISGMGKVMAERLVQRFGLQTLEVIEHHPARLSEVPGIGQVRKEQICKALAAQRHTKDIMVFLQSLGISSGYASRIYRRYRDQSVSLIRQNPYRLAIDIPGIGFKTADAIAAHLGISRLSPLRGEAGVLHTLAQLASNGHIACPEDSVLDRASELLGVERDVCEGAIRHLMLDHRVEREASLRDAGEVVYLPHLYAAEKSVATHLQLLLRAPGPSSDVDGERAIAWYERTAGITLAEKQRAALVAALSHKVLVLTGGPGTGKTTLVNGILRILEKRIDSIVLAAPTGRAAKRMSEATGREAKTIHRLLDYNPRTGFVRNENNRLDAKLLIVDEASMIDTVLMSHLLRALPTESRLIVVGDTDQLPSVGPGSVLGDIVRSGAVPVVRLDSIFRQGEGSLIVENAHRINRGERPLASRGDSSDFYFIEKESPEEILQTVRTLLLERIPKRFGLHAVHDVQVLSPMVRGPLGVLSLNQHLQGILNPHRSDPPSSIKGFFVGDKVMQMHNNYELDVFNGDIGSVTHIDEEGLGLTVRHDERDVRYELADLESLSLAYACTIHKSQGSEYPCVVLPLHTQHFVMLRRNLLYTAITRARKLMVIVGNRQALSTAIRTEDSESRFTQLAERLRQHDAPRQPA